MVISFESITLVIKSKTDWESLPPLKETEKGYSGYLFETSSIKSNTSFSKTNNCLLLRLMTSSRLISSSFKFSNPSSNSNIGKFKASPFLAVATKLPL